MDIISDLDKFKGCLLGVAIGDSLGLPFETWRASKIKKKVGSITGYNSISKYRNLSNDIIDNGPGTWSDDTELTLAVANSIIDSGKFDNVDMALKHVLAYEKNQHGWGKSTKNSVKQLKSFFDSRGTFGTSPNERKFPLFVGSINDDSEKEKILTRQAGNGVAMKIAPLILFYILNGNKIPELEIYVLANLTHSNPLAAIAAIRFAKSLWESYTNKQIFPKFSLENEYNDNRFQNALDKAKGLSDETLISTIGNGCYCLESVPFAIEMANRYSSDFRSAVCKTVEAGGDCDSTASMVGAIVGAKVGINGIPKKWILPCHDVILKTAENLYNVALTGISRKRMV